MIRMSYEGDGTKLSGLARSSRNPASFIPPPCLPILLLESRGRWSFAQIISVRPQVVFPSVPTHIAAANDWSLFLGFFVILAPSLPFLFGRVVEIMTFIRVCATDPLLVSPSFFNRTNVRYTTKF